MFRVLLCFLIAAASLGIANAQDQWARTIGSTKYESADYFDIDANGNSYIVGRYTDSLDLGNGIIITTTKEFSKFVAKFNSNGTCEWARSITNSKSIDRIISAALDSNGNIYITGEYQDTLCFSNDINLTPKNEPLNSQMCYVAKYSPNGECLWAKTFSGKGLEGNSYYEHIISKMVVDYDGEVYLVGQYYKEFTVNNLTKLTSGSDDYANYIVKFNTDGEYQWANSLRYCSYGVDNNETIGGIRSIATDSDGNFFVAGGFQDSLSFGNNVSLYTNDNSAGYIARYNTDGVCQWAKAIDGTAATTIISISLDAKSNLHLLGSYSATLSFGEEVSLNTLSPNSRFIAQYNTNGEFEWTTNVASGYTRINHLYLDVNGNTYLRGICYSSPIIFNEEYSIASDSLKANIFLVKYDTLGRFNWFRNICQMWWTPTLCGVVVDKNGNIYIAGEHSGSNWFSNNLTIVSNGSQDCYMAKIDPNTIIYPLQKYPINQSDYMNINTYLEWHPIAGATSYRLQVSTSYNFSSPLIDEVIDQATTKRTLNNLQYNTKYYWRMQTLINSDTTVWSPIWNFQTGYDPNAQVWAQSFGLKESTFSPTQIAVDSNSNFYLTGGLFRGNMYLGNGAFSILDSKPKAYIAKFDSFTRPDWAFIDNCANFSQTVCISADKDENFVVGGIYKDSITLGTNNTLISTGKDDIFLAKYLSSGECLWAKSVGGFSSDSVSRLFKDNNGNLCMIATYSDSIALGNNILLKAIAKQPTQFLAKFNSDGEVIQAYNLTSGGDFNAVTYDYEGNLYVVGNYSDTLFLSNTQVYIPQGSSNSLIAKYNVQGELLGIKSYIGNNNAKGIVVDSLGNIYVAGRFINTMKMDKDTMMVSNGNYDGYIVKYDKDGNLIWTKHILGSSSKNILDLRTDNNGHLMIFGTYVGTIEFGNGIELAATGQNDVYIARMNLDGKFSWAKNNGVTAGNETLRSVAIDNSNNIYLLGGFEKKLELGSDVVLTNDGKSNSFLIKYKALFVNPPALISPIFDSKNLNPNVELSWSGVQNINKYRVQISVTKDFATPITDEVIVNTSSAFTSLLDSTKYYWRVKALTDTDSTDWSVIWSFTTGATADVAESDNDSFSISPQPVRNEAVVTFNIENANAGISIELYDLKGTIIATYNFTSLSEGTNKLRLDVSNIPSGMYNAVIKNGAEVHNAKLIKVN